MNALSGIIYPTFMRTTGTGAGFTVGRIGAIIGPNLAGYLVFLQVPTFWIFFTGAAPMIPAGIACWYLGENFPARKAALAAFSSEVHTRGRPREVYLAWFGSHASYPVGKPRAIGNYGTAE